MTSPKSGLQTTHERQKQLEPRQSQCQVTTGKGKNDFNSIYNQPYPGPYLNTLCALDYQIPQHGVHCLRNIISWYKDATRDSSVGDVKVLDVCCSYGINSALLRHDLNLNTMAMHYRSTADEPLEQRTLIDREFFEACKRSLEPSVIGLDISTNAIRYGTATGLLASGWTENLELSSPSSELAEALRDVNIVLCTGGGSYVGPNTFARIAAANKNPSQLWMVAFVLRTYTFEGTATVLSHYGLITEKVPGVAFKQRRFKTVSEQSWAVSAVLDRGLDPLGLEEDGWLYADCYITRPQLQASKQPAAELIKPRIEQGSNAED